MAARRPTAMACACVGLGLVLSGWVFAAALNTRARAKRGPAPAHQYVAPFEAKEWLDTREEYNRMPSRAADKSAYDAAIEEFLAEGGRAGEPPGGL